MFKRNNQAKFSDVIDKQTKGKLGVILILLLVSLLDGSFWSNRTAQLTAGIALFLLFAREIATLVFAILARLFPSQK